MLAGEAVPRVGTGGGRVAAQDGAGAREVFSRLDGPTGAGALEAGVEDAPAAALDHAAADGEAPGAEGAVAQARRVGGEVGDGALDLPPAGLGAPRDRGRGGPQPQGRGPPPPPRGDGP